MSAQDNRLTVSVRGSEPTAGLQARAWASIGSRVVTNASTLSRDSGEPLPHPDALVITTSQPAETERLVRAAVGTTQRVLCDMHLGSTARSARDLVDFATSQGVQIIPMSICRWLPQYQTIADAAATGRLGTVAVFRHHRTIPTSQPATGPDLDSLPFADVIKDLDLVCWIVGTSAESAYATINQSDSDHLAMTCHAVLTHTGGAISNIRWHWAPTSIRPRFGLDVAGTMGSLHYDTIDDASLRTSRSGHPDSDSELQWLHQNPYERQAAHIKQAVINDTPTDPGIPDAIRAITIADALRESIRTGRPVSVIAKDAE